VLYGCAQMSRAHLHAWRPRLLLAAIVAAALLAAAGAPAATVPTITATVAPAEIALGASVTVTGTLAGAGEPPPGSPSPAAPVHVALQADPYPFRGYSTVARADATPAGAFSFTGIHPDRNTRLRVVLDANPAVASAPLPVIVDPRVSTASHGIGPGQTLLSIRLRHTRLGGAGTAVAWWYVQARGSRVYRLAAATPTRELAPGLLYASAMIDPPSPRFSYRVCINPAWEGAMGAPGAHGRCPRHDFVLHPGHAR
jgi:hypothetical protein